MSFKAAVAAGAGDSRNVKLVAGPLFTPQSDGSVVVWLQIDRRGDIPLEFRVGQDGEVQTVKPKVAKRCIYIHNLGQSADKEMSVRVGAHQFRREDVAAQDLISNHRIPAYPTPGRSGKFTLAFGSCANQAKWRRQPIWKAVAAQKPGAFLFIGDNIYLPNRARQYPDERDRVRIRYRDTYDLNRQVPDLQPVLKSTMSFALWDDHDFGPNNSDRTWKWKDVALEVLNEYFPNQYGIPGTPGCFFKFAWGDVDVFMLDCRTYRDPNRHPERRTFLGDKQLAWLKTGLAESKATFKLVVCGNQILTDEGRNESWGVQFKPERDAFLQWLWNEKVRGVIFLSGDRHFAEVMRVRDPRGIGHEVWELTSSPLAQNHYEEAVNVANSLRLEAYTSGVNFGLLKIDTTGEYARAELRVLDQSGKTVIRKVVDYKKPSKGA